MLKFPYKIPRVGKRNSFKRQSPYIQLGRNSVSLCQNKRSSKKSEIQPARQATPLSAFPAKQQQRVVTPESLSSQDAFTAQLVLINSLPHDSVDGDDVKECLVPILR